MAERREKGREMNEWGAARVGGRGTSRSPSKHDMDERSSKELAPTLSSLFLSHPQVETERSC